MQTAEYKSNELQTSFWNYACTFYEKKANKTLLLSLQDDYGINVNRLLFCCWFSQNFQVLIRQDSISNEPETFSSLETSVSQLRGARRDFEAKWKKPIIGHYNMARYHLLESELALEKEFQSLLVEYYCNGQIELNAKLDEITLDFLIMENIEQLCLGASINKLVGQELRNRLQQLSLNWINFEN